MNPDLNGVGPEFFTTLGIPLLSGRDFTEADDLDAPRVAVVNEMFARYFFGESDPIGRRFTFGRYETEVVIVGVARKREVDVPPGGAGSIPLPPVHAVAGSRRRHFLRARRTRAGGIGPPDAGSGRESGFRPPPHRPQDHEPSDRGVALRRAYRGGALGRVRRSRNAPGRGRPLRPPELHRSRAHPGARNPRRSRRTSERAFSSWC